MNDNSYNVLELSMRVLAPFRNDEYWSIKCGRVKRIFYKNQPIKTDQNYILDLKLSVIN
jgi:hypothetical protein